MINPLTYTIIIKDALIALYFIPLLILCIINTKHKEDYNDYIAKILAKYTLFSMMSIGFYTSAKFIYHLRIKYA